VGRRGRKRQLEVEARYWQLLQSGMGTVNACRKVGITRKTGYRWRAEVGGLVPVRLAEAVRSNRYLSLLERQRIASLHRQGVSIREIARRLERNASTVSRELRRNSAPHDRGEYDAPLAHSRARARGARPGRSRLATDPGLRAEVQDKLEVEWSPEQIAAHLRMAFPDKPSWHLCHETIYPGALPRPPRWPQPAADQAAADRSAATKAPASLGPAPHPLRGGAPADRAPAGDRYRAGTAGRLTEGDLVVGTMSKSAVATLVDRRSRYLRLIHLPDGHRADQPVTALEAALASMSAGKRLTLTWDQGSEMARHDKVAQLFSQGVFFANPGSPWMRGTNENTNGLLRQYLPKGTDLHVHDAAGLAVIETKLNTRPRKIRAGKPPRRSSGWQHH
jgi:transposase, IS30 family